MTHILEQYSEKEIELFTRLGLQSMMEVYPCPPKLYQDVALNLFKEKRSGPLVESVRRCLIAIEKCSPYRKTPEWEDLIQFE